VDWTSVARGWPPCTDVYIASAGCRVFALQGRPTPWRSARLAPLIAAHWLMDITGALMILQL
jgi:hypothetical protein